MKQHTFSERTKAARGSRRSTGAWKRPFELVWQVWILTLVSCALVAPGARALDSLVVPNGLENTDGNLNDNGRLFEQGDPAHWQQDYRADQFGAAKGPLLIKEIRFRIDADPLKGRPFDAVLPGVEISLSTTHVAPSAMSVFFAQNIGPDEKVVFPQGPLHLQSQGQGFDVVIGLLNPYLYDPAAGNLLMDLTYPGGVFTNSRLDTDQQLPPNRSTAALWLGGLAGTFGELQGMGLVTQFGFEPVPEPRSLVLFFACVASFLMLRSTFPKRSAPPAS